MIQWRLLRILETLDLTEHHPGALEILGTLETMTGNLPGTRESLENPGIIGHLPEIMAGNLPGTRTRNPPGPRVIATTRAPDMRSETIRLDHHTSPGTIP